MERYIGVLKGMVSLMSDIEANLASKVITYELLNHLPLMSFSIQLVLTLDTMRSSLRHLLLRSGKITLSREFSTRS